MEKEVDRLRKTSPLILALDVADIAEARDLAGGLKDYVDIVKVGMQLFFREGPGAVQALREDGFEVFLDLKISDIPNTVASACRSLCELEPVFLTVYAMGGQEMMRAAATAVAQHCASHSLRRPMLIGVTVLTSLDMLALKKTGVAGSVEDEVRKLSRLVAESELDGLVASPLETAVVRREVGGDMIVITPGIRPVGSEEHDQKRVATPSEAVEAGADFLVAGRPLYLAPDPGAAASKILAEIEEKRD